MPSFTNSIPFLAVRDLEATARFYEDVLNLSLALDQGRCRIYRVGAGFLGFCERPDERFDTGAVIATLLSQEVDQWYAALCDHGVYCEAEPTINPELLIYHFFFRDPSGYLLEIQRFEDPRWSP